MSCEFCGEEECPQFVPEVDYPTTCMNCGCIKALHRIPPEMLEEEKRKEKERKEVKTFCRDCGEEDCPRYVKEEEGYDCLMCGCSPSLHGITVKEEKKGRRKTIQFELPDGRTKSILVSEHDTALNVVEVFPFVFVFAFVFAFCFFFFFFNITPLPDVFFLFFFFSFLFFKPPPPPQRLKSSENICLCHIEFCDPRKKKSKILEPTTEIFQFLPQVLFSLHSNIFFSFFFFFSFP